MVRKLLYATAICLLMTSFVFAEDQPPANEKVEKKDEKPKREPVVDVFTRIDQGEGEVDALVLYAHPLYFAYKGLFDDAKKKYEMDKFHVFMVTINSQKKLDLSKFKVETSIFIQTEDGLEYPAVPQWVPLDEKSPNKRSGIVRFFQVDAQGNKIIPDKAKSLVIIIKGLADVPERVFRWNLPIEF